jgi:methylenetetrahydrofolate reductase (NADPH)
MSALQDKLALGDFVVTAEVTPPLSASAEALLARVAPLRGLVDAVNVNDAAGARASMSSFAAAAILRAAGVEPILQIACRDRNRLALAGDLLGAAAQGVENLLILHGDDPKAGDMPEAKPVYDLDSRGTMALAKAMRDQGKLPSGRAIRPPPRFFIGCADTAIDPPAGWQPSGLAGKIAAGAQFAQMQFCFDIALARRYFAKLGGNGITAALKMIAGIGPLAGVRQALYLRDNFYGVAIPDRILARLERASDPKVEGLAICAELIAELRSIAGVAGVHIMAPMQPPAAIAAAIAQSGLR